MAQKRIIIAGVKAFGSGVVGAVGVFAVLAVAPVVVSADNGVVGSAGTGKLTINTVTSGNANLGAVGVGKVKISPLVSGHVAVGTSGRCRIIVNTVIKERSGIVCGVGRVVAPSVTLYGAWAQPIIGSGGIVVSATVSASSTPSISTATSAWALNTATAGHSTYTNFPFSGMGRLGTDYYGVNSTGIYKLSGDKDVTTDIPWSITSGVSEIGERKRKFARDAYIYMRAVDTVTFRTIVDEQLDRADYELEADENPGVHRRRIKLSRKLCGTAWQINITGNGPATIQQVEIETLESKRV